MYSFKKAPSTQVAFYLISIIDIFIKKLIDFSTKL